MALPKQNRLRLRQDFKNVYHNGIRRTGRYLTLRALRQDGRGAYFSKGKAKDAQKTPASACIDMGEEKLMPTRIGISISSQKVSKKAVVRNRVKRQIRAALRHLLPRISNGWMLIFIVQKTVLECDYTQLLRELEQLLVEAEVLNER